MKVILAEHYGVCFGVRDAIAQAEQLAARQPLTILGELVHNPIVRDRLRHLGAREGDLAQTTSAATEQVLVTAHGASHVARERWREAGFAVNDATCPLVRKAHQILGSLVASGCHPVVIGQRGHAEVLGLTGDFPSASVISTLEEVAQLPPATRYGVISQTTQPIAFVQAMVERIRSSFPGSEVRFVDTVCQPTKNRQTALQTLLAQVEAMVVVGGRNSNNTRQLVRAAEAAGLPTWHVEAPAELQPEWFEDVAIVGVTAGTSTLRETVAAVCARLESIAALQPHTL